MESNDAIQMRSTVGLFVFKFLIPSSSLFNAVFQQLLLIFKRFVTEQFLKHNCLNQMSCGGTFFQTSIGEITHISTNDHAKKPIFQ